jgi:hypothetical protein
VEALTITEFLTARADEAQGRADEMGHAEAGSEACACPATRTEPLGDLPFGEENCDCGLATRKARALREVVATRAIIRRYGLAVSACRSPSVSGFVRGRDTGYAQACLDAITDIAAVHSDHPDYDQEGWKP